MLGTILFWGIVLVLVVLVFILLFGKELIKKHPEERDIPAKPEQTIVNVSQQFSPISNEERLRTQLQNATTISECCYVYERAPYGSELETEAFNRYKSLFSAQLTASHTLEEVLELKDELASDDDAVAKEFFSRLENEIRARVETISSIEDGEKVIDVLDDLPDDYEHIFDLVFLKMLSIASSHEECMELFDNFEMTDAVNDAVLRRGLALATTGDECDEVYSRTDDDYGPSDEEIDQKKIDLATTVEDCQSIWNDIDDTENKTWRAAVCKAADLIRSEAE